MFLRRSSMEEARSTGNQRQILDTKNVSVSSPLSLPQAVRASVGGSFAVGNLKRQRENEVADAEAGTLGDVPEAKRRVKAIHDVFYRILVPPKQIGKVIGKAGHRIQKIREDAKATIKIADAIGRHEERVIIISSKDNENTFSDAENALHQIMSLLLKDDVSNLDAVKIGPGHITANTVRLLIAGCQARSLIGVSDQNMENLQSTSGAVISVLSPSQMPLCAAHESDRIVQISGEVPAILRAVVEIARQLRDNPPKQVISITPTNDVGPHKQPQQYVDPTSADYATMDVLVPENLVGGLIGRFGANISRIRNESGANIKVYGGRGEQKQRQIHLSGSVQQVALAKQRVDEYTYAELMRQAGDKACILVVNYSTYLANPPCKYPIRTKSEMSNPLYPIYSHLQSFYPTSVQQAGLFATIPAIYTSTQVNQGPIVYASSAATNHDPSYYINQ